MKPVTSTWASSVPPDVVAIEMLLLSGRLTVREVHPFAPGVKDRRPAADIVERRPRSDAFFVADAPETDWRGPGVKITVGATGPPSRRSDNLVEISDPCGISLPPAGVQSSLVWNTTSPATHPDRADPLRQRQLERPLVGQQEQLGAEEGLAAVDDLGAVALGVGQCRDIGADLIAGLAAIASCAAASGWPRVSFLTTNG